MQISMTSSAKEVKRENRFTHKIYTDSNTNKTAYKYTELDSDLLIESLEPKQSIRVLSIKKKGGIQAVPVLLSVIVAFNLVSFYNETKIINAVNFQTSLLTGLTYRVNDLYVEYSNMYQKLLTATNERIAQEVRKIVYRSPAAKTASSKKIKNKTTKRSKAPKAALAITPSSVPTSQKENLKNKSRAQAILEAEMEAEKAQTSRFLNMDLFEEERANQRNSSNTSSVQEVKPEFERAQTPFANRKND